MEQYEKYQQFLVEKKKKKPYLELCRYCKSGCKCPKILYTKISDKMAYANTADPDQIAPEGLSNQGLHCLPFH